MSSKSDNEEEEEDLNIGESLVVHMNKNDALKALETMMLYAETLEREDDSNVLWDKLLDVEQLMRNVQSPKQMKITDFLLNKS